MAQWCIFRGFLAQWCIFRGFFADVFIQSDHSFTHSHTGGGVNHTGREPARQEQLGLRRLAQGHLDTQLGVAGDRTSQGLPQGLVTLRLPVNLLYLLSNCCPRVQRASCRDLGFKPVIPDLRVTGLRPSNPRQRDS